MSTRNSKASAARRIAFLDDWPGYLGWTFVAAIVLTVLFGIVPFIVVAVIGLGQGTIPSSDAGGIYGTGPGYPLFQPPFWLLWIPAVLTLVLSVGTIPMRSKLDSFVFSVRGDLAVFAFVGFVQTIAAAGAFGGPQAVTLLWASLVWLVAVALFAVRGLVDLVGQAFGSPARRPRRPPPPHGGCRPSSFRPDGCICRCSMTMRPLPRGRSLPSRRAARATASRRTCAKPSAPWW